GNVRSGLGHPEAGEMLGDVRSVRQEAAVVHGRGLLLRGPVARERAITVRAPGAGGVVAQLVCVEQAVALAKAFLAGEPLPAVPTVAAEPVREQAVLDATASVTCPLVQVIRPLAPSEAAGRIEVSYTVDARAARL